jgi:uncharacterized delta-60 repeat protein
MGQQNAGTADPAFPASVGFGSSFVNGFLEQPDRRILVFGGFRVVNGVGRVSIARLNPDGSVDSSFTPKPGPDGPIFAVALQADGKILIGGDFSLVDGINRQGAARLNSDGTLDQTFNANATTSILSADAVALLPSGKILISVNGDAYQLNSDGSRDNSFGVSGQLASNGTIRKFIPLANGQCYLLGADIGAGVDRRKGVVRINGNGTVDLSFNLRILNPSFSDLVIQPDNRLVVVGDFDQDNNSSTRTVQIARILANGDIDATLSGPTLDVRANFDQVILQPSGSFLIRGDTFLPDGRDNILRLGPTGAIDTTFRLSQEPDEAPSAIGLQANGGILIGGNFTSISGARRVALARTSSTGGLDQNFGLGSGIQSQGVINDILVQPDGRILICGRFDSVNGRPYGGIARLFLDGNVDESFLPGAGIPPDIFDAINTLALQPDGRILIGGDFRTVNGVSRGFIARLGPEGGLDQSFAPSFDDSVSKIVRQPDGRLLVAGRFRVINGVSTNGFARINSNGQLDTTFVPVTSNSGVITVLPLPSGKMLVGGSGGLCKRLNQDGSIDPTFNCIINGGAGTSQVFRFIVQPDRRILLCGNFSSCNGVFRNNIARVFEDGSLDTGFVPGATFSDLDEFFDMALQQDGKVVVVGDTFSSTIGIARMNRDGSKDSTFLPGRGLEDAQPAEWPEFNRVVLLPDSSLLCGGSGAAYDTVAKGGLFRIFSGNTCGYSLSASSAFFQIAGGTGSVTLTTGSPTCEWVVDGVPDWITGFPTSGVGTTTFNFTVAPNPGRARTAFLSIGGQQFIVSQADTCSYTIAPTTISVPFNGGNASVTINASSSDCEWTVLSLPNWVSDFPTTGTGTQTIQFFVDFNPGFARTAVISVNGVSFQITQAPNPCPFQVSPTEFKVGGKVGFRSVSVTANPGCLWSAVRSVTWASINSGTGGTGSGVVNFGFTRNPDLESGRTGILFIAGQQVKIKQGPGRGRTTLGVFRQSNGLIYQRNSPTTGFAENEFIYGIQNDVPVSGDWDGDGKDSPGIYRNGVFYLRNSNNTGVADLEIAFGNPGDIPIVGDWDGDGVDTVGTFRNGVFYLRNSNTQGFADIVIAYGSTGDRPVVGDWDGNGTDTVGVFRNGLFYLRNTNTTGFADIQLAFGAATDIPISGDWDGDGVDTIGVYRNGTFFLRNSNTTGQYDIGATFGSPGDLPIIGEWRNVDFIE